MGWSAWSAKSRFSSSGFAALTSLVSSTTTYLSVITISLFLLEKQIVLYVLFLTMNAVIVRLFLCMYIYIYVLLLAMISIETVVLILSIFVVIGADMT